MAKVHLAFLWHQHQPCYRDLLTGDVAMPWVRLHGSKDYFGMAALAEEFPSLRLNINLVPCLIRQLEEFLSGEAVDRHLRRSRIPASDLSEDDRAFILQNFFVLNTRFIQAHSRFAQLWEKAAQRKKSPGRATRDFSTQEFLDLQVLGNLAWFHPIVLERDEQLRDLRHRGRDFAEEDKALVLARQRDVVAQVIPLHKRLQDEGKIEVTTTPYYHPILPLLLNTESARVAMPGCKLPQVELPTAEDARVHLRRAVETYRRLFARAPRGLWPSEGSVSPDILPLLEEQGFEWLATDEEILTHSLGRWLSRDGRGQLENPDLLYRPYRVPAGRRDLGMVFRDLRLSDLIGFQYQHEDPRRAAEDFVRRIREAGRRSTHAPVLVSIILDGENAWEHYPNNGIEFLRSLYREISSDPELETVRIGDFLAANPPTERIATLYSGSWISHNFSIWIGHEEDRKAWEYLGRVRQDLVAAAREGAHVPSPAAAAKAWDCLYAAEGSDWFWWFGDDHSTALDLEFDALFRTHLMNVYRALGREVPGFLYEPIKRRRADALFTAPKGFLTVRIDGRRTDYFEWIGAGQYQTTRDVSAMDRTTKPLFTQIQFGFDAENFYLLLESHRPAREALGKDYRLAVVFAPPRAVTLEIRSGTPGPTVRLLQAGGDSRSCGTAAVDRAVELGCPFRDLGMAPRQLVEFHVEATVGGEPAGRFPAAAPLSFEVPTPDFEKLNWQA